MAELVKDKRIEGIADLRDESDRDGMRIFVEIKRDANPHKVLNNLFKHTPMQLAFNMNMLALVDGQPQTLPAAQRPRPLHRRTAARSSGAGPSSTSARPAPGRTSSKASRSRSTTSTRSSRRSASRPDVELARTNLMKRFDLSRAPGPGDPGPAARPPGRPRAQEDRGRVPLGHPAHRRARGHPRQPGPRPVDHQGRARRAEEEVRRRAPDPGRRRREPRDDRRGPHRRRGRRRDDLRPRLHQAPAGRHVPPPASRRQGDHRPRHARGGRGRAPARREHPRLGAVLHEPRPGVLGQGPRHPRCQPAGQGHPDHQPARRPGGVGRGPDGHDHAARTSRPGSYLVLATPQGHRQEDAARAVREGPLVGDPGDHHRTTTTSSPGSTSRPAATT